MKITADANSFKQGLPGFLMLSKHLQDKNLGTIIASQAVESLRFKNTPELCMTIFWSAYPIPPHFKPLEKHNNKVLRPEVTLTGVKRNNLDYDLIKQLAGGTAGYNYGRHKAIARLSNGSKVLCHAGSRKAAEERVLNLVTQLTDLDILTFTYGEELDEIEGQQLVRRRGSNLYKPLQKIYPYAIAFLNKQRLIRAERTGRQLLDGKLGYEYSPLMPLWWKQKPRNWEDWIQEYTKRVDPD